LKKAAEALVCSVGLLGDLQDNFLKFKQNTTLLVVFCLLCWCAMRTYPRIAPSTCLPAGSKRGGNAFARLDSLSSARRG